MLKKLTLLFLLLSTAISAETVFKIFTLQHNFADDLLPIVSPMVGPDGTATGVNNQLIIRAAPARMQEIEQIVAELDKAKPNRKITVRTDSYLDRQEDITEATGAVKVGKTTVSNRRSAPPNSGRVDVERNSSQTSRSTDQFINVLDGGRAFIRVGQIVPFTQEWITVSRQYIDVQRFTDWREISTGFAVSPRTVGNQVELTITPRISNLNGQGLVDFETLSTTMRVALGDWVDIGGTMQNNDQVSRKILGLRRSASQQSSSLQIKVD